MLASCANLPVKPILDDALVNKGGVETPLVETTEGEGVDNTEHTESAAEEGEGASTKKSGAGVLLAFDDDYYASWEDAFPLFERYGAAVTFFVQGSAAFCRLAAQKGHAVGWHTKNHSDLRRLTRAEWEAETLRSAEVLRNEGVRFAAFAYPFGFSEDWMNGALLEAYPITRGFGVKDLFYTEDAICAGVIGAKSIDNTIIKDDAEFYAVIERLFTSAAESGNLIVSIATHKIADDALWGITKRRLEYLLRNAVEKKLVFYTYADFADGGHF